MQVDVHQIAHHQFAFLLRKMPIVPEKALHSGESQGSIELQSLLQLGIGGAEIALVEAVEHRDAVGCEDESRPFDAEFGERKLDHGVAPHAQCAAHALCGVGEIGFCRNFGHHRERFVGAVGVAAAQGSAAREEHEQRQREEKKQLLHNERGKGRRRVKVRCRSAWMGKGRGAQGPAPAGMRDVGLRGARV